MKFSTALRHNRRAPRVELCRAPCFYAASPAGPWAPWACWEGAFEGEWAVWGDGPSGPMGPFGVFPKLFRVDGYFELAISSGWHLRVEHSPNPNTQNTKPTPEKVCLEPPPGRPWDEARQNAQNAQIRVWKCMLGAMCLGRGPRIGHGSRE